MIRIFDIALKDLLQLLRDRKVFLFLLIMPVIFTFLFGFAFGGFSQDSADDRLPVGFLDQDGSRLSRQLRDLLKGSDVIRLETNIFYTSADLQSLVADDKLAAALIIPPSYGQGLLHARPEKLVLIGDTGATAGQSVESEALSASFRLESAVRTALILERIDEQRAPFDYTLQQALEAWQDPPIGVAETASSAIPQQNDSLASLAQTSPGFMLQFSIAGLLTSAQILVAERKSRSLQRLLTTATARVHIILGHYLAILMMIFCQFVLLILFGQLVLGLDYLRAPFAVLLLALATALCIAALGLLIGVLAHSEEQAIIFSLIPMFVLSGIGGAWVPLEVTGSTFQAIGHLSPVAWAMDGFKDILLRGLGWRAVLVPAAALLAYGALFFALAAWRFQKLQES
jgi:ABC-2 type transport system permease protein